MPLNPINCRDNSKESICNEALSKEESAQRLSGNGVEVSASKDGELQKCRICGIEKPLDEFYIRNDTKKYRSECKECSNEMARYRRLGVCNVKYDEMLTKQKGRCGICGSTLNNSRYTKLVVDHDHKTGKVRGLLCSNCNTAIGLLKESPVRLSLAIVYLERYRN